MNFSSHNLILLKQKQAKHSVKTYVSQLQPMSPFFMIKAAQLVVDFGVKCQTEVFRTAVCSPLTQPFERRKDFVT